eukprot:TRINITY_DN57216_c0_g1_i1.p1 TRINITY_DN57216_c0_g1~~TRINITY_DN57216_c0_g1_i1.p1  ORF type:complete len:546 (-),score=116.84 TRINITY_DN57216_c0_g1_i1:83-1720(-)
MVLPLRAFLVCLGLAGADGGSDANAAAAGSPALAPRCPPPTHAGGICALEESSQVDSNVAYNGFRMMGYLQVLSQRFEQQCLEEYEVDGCAKFLRNVALWSEFVCGVLYFRCFSSDEWSTLLARSCDWSEDWSKSEGALKCPTDFVAELKALHQKPLSRKDAALSQLALINNGNDVFSALLKAFPAIVPLPGPPEPLLTQVVLRQFQEPLAGQECKWVDSIREAIPGWLLRVDGRGRPLAPNPAAEVILAELVAAASGSAASARPLVLNLGAGDGVCSSDGMEYDPANCLVTNTDARGVWVEGDADAVAALRSRLAEARGAAERELRVVAQAIGPSDAAALLAEVFGAAESGSGAASLDFVKVDVDNCDCRLAEALLAALAAEGRPAPKMFFVEINPLWPPPSRLRCAWRDSRAGLVTSMAKRGFPPFSGCALQDYVDSLGDAYHLLFVETNNAVFIRRDLVETPRSRPFENAGSRTLAAFFASGLAPTDVRDAWNRGFWCRSGARFWGIPTDIWSDGGSSFVVAEQMETFFYSRWPGLVASAHA